MSKPMARNFLGCPSCLFSTLKTGLVAFVLAGFNINCLAQAQVAKSEVASSSDDTYQMVAKGSPAAASQDETLILWEKNFDSALTKAKSENKLVLVYVYAGWCSYCKQLSRNVFGSAILADHLNKRYACLKLDGEEAKEGRPFMRQYNLRGYPNTVVIHPLDPQNHSVITGALPATFYVIAVSKAAATVGANFDTAARLQKEGQAGPAANGQASPQANEKVGELAHPQAKPQN